MAEDEKRDVVRARTLLSGVLVYGEAGYTVDCAIRNLTEGGARLSLAGPVPVTPPVVLIDLRHDKAFNARVAWTRAAEIGLAFLGEIDLQAPANLTEKIARRLWTERRAR